MRAFPSLAASCLALLLTAAPAQAASYDFPSAMPAGCSGSNGSYTCSTGSLAWGDTVSLSGTRPATITFSGNLALNSAKINQAGNAGDLTLVVQGRLTPGYQAVINATVQAKEIHDVDGDVTFGGSARATAGSIKLAYRSSVAGSLTVDAGNAELADEAVVRGDISASAQVITAYRSQVVGSITAGGTVTVGQETSVGGAVVVAGNIGIGYAASVSGDIRSQAGTVTLAQAAVAKACVQALTSSRAVTLGYQASAGGVCCGNQGSCSSSCVRNNSTAAMPALCTVPRGSGLTGSYFSNMTLTAPASLERVDGTVAFDWVNASPATSLPADKFSVRWTGILRVPSTGSYRFQTRSDDGVRLWVDNVQRVNNWTNHAATLNNSTAVTLTAGVDYPLTMEFYENGGQAVASLHWLKPGDATYNVIPPGTVGGGGLFTSAPTPASPHHLEIQHASGTGLSCTPSTVTVKACADAACSTAYTEGVSGTLGATGGTVNWPAGAAFSIAAGSSSTTVSLQATTTTPTLLGVAGSTPAASSAASCNFGSPACTFSAADTGLLFNVPDHVSEQAQTVSVSAVKKADNSLACVPAFANVSKSVSFSCSYTNPASGSLAPRVAGTALNAAGNAAAACDSGGRAVTLAFNANGVASTTVQYADVGQLTLAARVAGTAGASDAGLVMSGSDSFIAAPQSLAITGVTAGPIKAGSPFAATVSARNAAGTITPNFGRETSPASAVIAFVKLQPNGLGTVLGSFSGSLGAFGTGTATATDLAWTEVGRGDLVARLSNGNYLGSGLKAYGASAATGAQFCAAENGTCALPAGVTATVYYGEHSSFAARTGQTGNVACSNGYFGDPLAGVVKQCFYAVTAASNGSVGDFIPHHFDVAASAACTSFSYAGQPFDATITARNAAGATTLNFDGAAAITPNFAQAVTLSGSGATGLGSLSGGAVAATAFTAGVASARPAFDFTSKTTAPMTLVLRAANTASGAAAISSAGYTEASMPLRSGRLRLSNAFGSASAALQLPVVAEHWSGNAWVLNSADSCTAVAAGSVALSNPRNAAGGASTASSAAGAITLVNGRGLLTLAAPTPAGSSLSLDLAINLGSTAADQSCQANHPASTGAAKAWLRAQNGSCATTADRDPAARASFGIFSPESRKTVHVRELF